VKAEGLDCLVRSGQVISAERVPAVKPAQDQLRAIIDTIPVLAWLSVEEARGWGWTAAVHPDDLKTYWN
jgi:hypothetical protein